MKVVLIKSEGAAPLATTKKHVDQINNVDKNIQVVHVLSTNKKEVEEHLIDADILACHAGSVPSIENAKSLKWIQVFSAGVDSVLTPEIKNSKILLTNVSGIHAIPIAEHVIGFMLLFTRKFYNTFKQQEKRIWQKNMNVTELREKTAIVVGLGNIGTEVARLTNCMGVNVIAVKKNTKDKPKFISQIYSHDKLDKILPKADFVISCLPHTKETHHLFDMDKFKKMKRSGIIINIGRGGLIRETDLINALKQNVIAGAGLDVTEEEPLAKSSKLWAMDNVIITPHHSGWSEKYMDRAIDVFCANLKAYIANRPIPTLVDKKRGY
jgi:D-2-hydroxyacid dehydrogenase (NADP+)